jgi:hypothetical protein
MLIGAKLLPALVAATTFAAVLPACGAGGQSRHDPAAARPVTTHPPSTDPAPVPVTAEPAYTVVARMHGDAPASVLPGEPPVAKVPGSWYGYPSVLPVIGERPGWVEVREAQRPNGSTAWIPLAYASISTTPYFLVVHLSSMHLLVYENGVLAMSLPTGVGTPSQPTVTGQFFLTMKVPAPSPGYGPFVWVTSAHSDVITDWEQSGDAIVAIHGPIDAVADRLIGSSGGRISHGCLRLHDADLARLAVIPPGTPLDIGL